MGGRIDNSPKALHAKVELREHILQLVNPCHVLDVFCGADGEMWNHVWKHAGSYGGIDKIWRINDTRKRYIGDAKLILRAIDLHPYNVFDLDAYSDPWNELAIIAERKQWAEGELGALCLTVSTLPQKMGTTTKTMSLFVKTSKTYGSAAAFGLVDKALHRACDRMHVQIRHIEHAKTIHYIGMCYIACVVRGY